MIIAPRKTSAGECWCSDRCAPRRSLAWLERTSVLDCFIRTLRTGWTMRSAWRSRRCRGDIFSGNRPFGFLIRNAQCDHKLLKSVMDAYEKVLLPLLLMLVLSISVALILLAEWRSAIIALIIVTVIRIIRRLGVIWLLALWTWSLLLGIGWSATLWKRKLSGVNGGDPMAV